MSVMAAAMGLVLGAILALPQWRVLRRAADRAWVWLPANSVAWAAGMPIVFVAVDLAYRAGTVWGAVGVMALALALTGAAVGALHGLALVWLASRARVEEGAER
jgi:NhaP-type Na+/H+ or K+/H+ antiporter